jgi:hypothetical protein
MRLGISILLGLALFGVAVPAAAERGDQTGWARPVVTLKLLDGWRASSPHVELGQKAAPTRETSEPGEDLSVVVERMWSQVRAYRRPGGAEFIVRGRF